MSRFTYLLLALSWGTAAHAQSGSSSSPYDSARFTLFKPVPRSQLRELRPDRPGVTESAFTVDAGHFQLETDGFRLINRREGDQREREWHAAFATAKLGLGRNTDFQLEVPVYAAQKQRQENEPDWQAHRGFGDVALRLKQNLIGNDGGKVALATLGYVRLPTGGQAGSGGVEGGLIVPVNVELTDKWELEAQVESDLNYDRDASNHYLQVIPSVALDREFTDKLSLLVEGVTRWDSQHSGWRSSINVAPIINISDNLQFDFGAHLALNRETDREYFVGFTFRR